MEDVILKTAWKIMHNIEAHKKELLRKYIDGSISVEDRHVLERYALDDAFLFDALEGYASVEGESSVVLHDLVGGLAQEGKENKSNRSFILKLASIAAGLILITVVGNLIMQETALEQIADNKTFTKDSNVSSNEVLVETLDLKEVAASDEDIVNEVNRNQDNDALIVKDEEENKVAEKIISPPPAVENILIGGQSPVVADAGIERIPVMDKDVLEISEEVKLEEKIVEEEIVEESEERYNRVEQESKVYETRKYQNSPVKKEHSMLQNYKKTIDPEVQDDIEKVKAKRKIPAEYKTTSRRKSTPTNQSDSVIDSEAMESPKTRLIEGQIVDNQGEPLIGANIVVQSTQIGTTTDIDGNFQVEIPLESEYLELSYTGFEQQVVSIDERSSYQLYMNASSELLDEIVVTNSVKKGIVYEPVMGLEAMRDFVEENIILDNCSTLQVILEFEVSATGQLKNIKSQNPNAPSECVAEAKRILLEAGPWKSIPRGLSGITQYSVYFRR